ncbi:MAG: GNAT family N-acetyltransferase [Candidatus Omnitrophica bacterium]|nr:GNAT family N-acetyltransferase [Candidatus Omnitrophota bacterium]
MLEIVLEERFPKPVKLEDGTRVILRPLIPQDESALVEFFKDMPEEDILYLRDEVKNPEVIKKWCQNLNYELILPLIAEIEGKIVGDASLHQERRGWKSHIGTVRIVIHPKYRGKGLATALVQEIIDVALDIGLVKLDAEFMAEQNRPIGIFEKLGFVNMAVLPQHVKDLKGESHDLVIMVYDLRATEHYAAD